MESPLSYCLEELRKGTDRTSILKELKRKRLSEDKASEVLRMADEVYLDEISVQKRDHYAIKLNSKWVAIALITLGSSVTLLSYFDVLAFGNYYIIFYGPILSGLAMLGYSRSREKSTKSIKSPYSSWRNR